MMKIIMKKLRFSLVIGFLLICGTLVNAGLGASHVFMEVSQPLAARPDIKRMSRANSNAIHEVVFEVKQKNMDKLEEVLHDVSDPSSPNYGRHWTKQQVVDFTANPEGRDALLSHLQDFSPLINIIDETLNGEFIRVSAPVSLWEQYLNCQFFEYEVSKPKQGHNRLGGVPTIRRSVKKLLVVRTEEYYLPIELVPYVSAVFNTVQFPTSNALDKYFRPVENRNVTGHASMRDPKLAAAMYTTPAIIRSVYHMSNPYGSSIVSQGIFASMNDAVSPNDLTKFQQTWGCSVQSIAGNTNGHVDNNACNPNYYDGCIESNLDVQYIMCTAQNIPTYYYFEPKASSDGFLDFVTNIANMANPPQVWSMSYCSYETEIPTSTKNSFTTQMIKLGTMGVTVLASSGDDGAPGYKAEQDGSKCAYSPMFPASHPYVTAVGGTTGPQQNRAEVACESGYLSASITTGGGFSAFYPTPTFQTDQVSSYLTSAKSGSYAPVSGYNAGGRGYPDVSLIASQYQITVNGQAQTVDGTSASSPVFAGFVSLVNSNRKTSGYSTMGWLNPFLYKYSSSFVNDINSGSNKCCKLYDVSRQLKTCCAQGFYALGGWDPVTGLGSVNYDSFLSTSMSVAAATAPTQKPVTRPPSPKPVIPPGGSAPPTKAPVSAAPSKSSAPTNSSSGGGATTASSAMSGGTIAGIVIGTLIGVSIIPIVGYFFYYGGFRRDGKKPTTSTDTEKSDTELAENTNVNPLTEDNVNPLAETNVNPLSTDV
jgi:tripeptidyl-peptidase-1